MSPQTTVYVPKSSGEIRIHVDCVQLNCVTKKESLAICQQLATYVPSIVLSTSLGKNKITHLGFEYLADGVAPSSEKIEDIPVPKNIKDLQLFLGLTNAGPLTALTSKNVQFTWDGTHQQAFATLKHALVSFPVLDYLTKHDTFVLTTDTSDTGVGVILSRARGAVLEYTSRVLTKAELSYSTTAKECLYTWATHKLQYSSAPR